MARSPTKSPARKRCSRRRCRRRPTVSRCCSRCTCRPRSRRGCGDLGRRPRLLQRLRRFAADGREYVDAPARWRSNSHPWINVISNDSFGFHVSAEGAGFTWSRNSRDYQLTPWTNDPVINRPGEAVFIRDLAGDAVLTPYAALSRRLRRCSRPVTASAIQCSRPNRTISKSGDAHRASQSAGQVRRVSIRNTGTAARRLRAGYGMGSRQ